MMKLKITKGFVKADNIIIADVMECDEHLTKGYGVSYGNWVYRVMDSNVFFEDLKRAIKEGYVFKLISTQGVYKLGYLEVRKGLLNSVEVELDVSDMSDEFKMRLDELVNFYLNGQKRYSKNTFRLLREKGNPNDALVDCCKRIYEYSVSGRVEHDICEERFEGLYNRLEGNYGLLKNAPMKSPKMSKDGKSYLLFTSGISAIVFGGGMLMMKPLAGLIGFLGLFGYSVGSTVISRYSEIAENKIYVLTNFTNDFRKVYGRDFIRNLHISIRNAEIKKARRNFVDFVETDLTYAPCEYQDGLVNLADAYSEEKNHEVFDGHSPVDKFKYIMRLIELESKMYADDGTLRFVNRVCITPTMLDERLVFLGWSSERVEKDEFLIGIRSAMKEISLRPYNGVEVELLAIMKLAVQYVGVESMSRASVEKMNELMVAIVDKAHFKLEVARRNELKADAYMSQTDILVDDAKFITEGRRHMAMVSPKQDGLQ